MLFKEKIAFFLCNTFFLNHRTPPNRKLGEAAAPSASVKGPHYPLPPLQSRRRSLIWSFYFYLRIFISIIYFKSLNLSLPRRIYYDYYLKKKKKTSDLRSSGPRNRENFIFFLSFSLESEKIWHHQSLIDLWLHRHTKK